MRHPLLQIHTVKVEKRKGAIAKQKREKQVGGEWVYLYPSGRSKKVDQQRGCTLEHHRRDEKVRSGCDFSVFHHEHLPRLLVIEPRRTGGYV